MKPKTKKTPRILFVSSRIERPFIETDKQILQRNFQFKNFKLESVVPRKKTIKALIGLTKEILHCDIVYSWWADLHGVLVVLVCMLLHKKSVIVVGGYEVSYLPKIRYGKLLSMQGRIQVKFILKHSSTTLVVSKSSANETQQFTKPKNLKVVYNCVDTHKFHPSGAKQNIVLTVAGNIYGDRIKTKGVDKFLQASRLLPNVQFILVGNSIDDSMKTLKATAGPNVVFPGFLSSEALLPYYQKAKVYCQFSEHESFGVALAEAMSCCCVPVVIKKFSLPEIVEDTGFCVSSDDPQIIADTINIALKSDKGQSARERIERHFSIESREETLTKEIGAIANS